MLWKKPFGFLITDSFSYRDHFEDISWTISPQYVFSEISNCASRFSLLLMCYINFTKKKQNKTKKTYEIILKLLIDVRLKIIAARTLKARLPLFCQCSWSSTYFFHVHGNDNYWMDNIPVAIAVVFKILSSLCMVYLLKSHRKLPES